MLIIHISSLQEIGSCISFVKLGVPWAVSCHVLINTIGFQMAEIIYYVYYTISYIVMNTVPASKAKTTTHLRFYGEGRIAFVKTCFLETTPPLKVLKGFCRSAQRFLGSSSKSQHIALKISNPCAWIGWSATPQQVFFFRQPSPRPPSTGTR